MYHKQEPGELSHYSDFATVWTTEESWFNFGAETIEFSLLNIAHSVSEAQLVSFLVGTVTYRPFQR
jgi:hypothetical protein